MVEIQNKLKKRIADESTLKCFLIIALTQHSLEVFSVGEKSDKEQDLFVRKISPSSGGFYE